MLNIMRSGWALTLVPLLFLAGCGGGEPGEDDMRGALQAQFDQANKASGGGKQFVIHEFKKLNCAKADASTVYTCSVTLRVEGPWINNGGTTEMKFTKGEAGWVIVQ